MFDKPWKYVPPSGLVETYNFMQHLNDGKNPGTQEERIALADRLRNYGFRTEAQKDGVLVYNYRIPVSGGALTSDIIRFIGEQGFSFSETFSGKILVTF